MIISRYVLIHQYSIIIIALILAYTYIWLVFNRESHIEGKLINSLF